MILWPKKHLIFGLGSHGTVLNFWLLNNNCTLCCGYINCYSLSTNWEPILQRSAALLNKRWPLTYTKSGQFITLKATNLLHQKRPIYCTKSSHVGVQNTAALGNKMQPWFVTNTAAFCAQNAAMLVHKTRLCWCTNHDCILYPSAAVVCTPTWPHILYPNVAVVCTPTQLEYMHQHSCVLCTECGRVGAKTMAMFCSPMQPCFVDLRYKM